MENHAITQLLSRPLFTIFHFNDVYDIQSKKGKGGIVNFKSKLQQFRTHYSKNNSLLLFSGDAMSPSILSRTHSGWQMVKALNSLNIDVACFGNHQFDYQEKHAIQLTKACNFPWLLGNIKHIENGRILGDGIPYIIKKLQNGLKIGIFGVAGEDWLSILNQQYQGLLQCQNVKQYCKRISRQLKQQQNCDFIIALTHCRNNADLQLAAEQNHIDIILGGHDHIVMNKYINNTPIIKSGCNFLQIGVIDIHEKTIKSQYKQNIQQTKQQYKQNIQQINTNVIVKKSLYDPYFYKGKNYDFKCQVHQVSVAQPQKIDLQLQNYVDQMMSQYQKFDKIIGYSDCPLQARFNIIRTRESNYGNFFIDLFRLYHNTDIALLNSGCIRNDTTIPSGYIKFSILSNIIDDQIVVKMIKGNLIRRMLQYAVIGLPNSYMGSFLFVSGIKYSYDLNKIPRVQQIYWEDDILDEQRQYSIAMPSYMANGGDGFDYIRSCPKIIDQAKGISIMNLLLKFFSASDIKHLSSYKKIHSHKNISQKHIALDRIYRIKQLRTRFQDNVQEEGEKLVCIQPVVDGRIICLNQKE